MKLYIKKIFIFLFSFVMISSALTGADEKAPEKNDTLVFIVNPALSATLKLTPAKIKDIFIGKAKYEGKIKLSPVNLVEEKVFGKFLKEYVGMTPAAYKSSWVKKVFSEGGAAPKAAENAEQVKKLVTGSEGGIGYIMQGDLSEDDQNIKVAPVQQKK